MPPLLFKLLSMPFVKLAHSIFPTHIAYGLIAGAYFFYVGCEFFALPLSCFRQTDFCYAADDTMHYALHHTKLPQVRIFTLVATIFSFSFADCFVDYSTSAT